MQQYYKQGRKLNKLKASLLMLMMVLFASAATAQNVYMSDGSRNVSSAINFYDSGGQSSGPEYYWERWFQRNEHYTYTFRPLEPGKKIKVTFKKYTAWLDTGGSNHSIGTNWSLRLNTATLSIYDGETAVDANLITTYTGNMTEEFTVIANGAMTFKFDSYDYREEGWAAEVVAVDDYTVQKPQISFEVCSDNVVINANNKGAEVYYTTDGNDPVVDDPLTGATLYDGSFPVNPGTTIKAIARLNGTNSGITAKEFTEDDVTPTPGVPTITRTENTITMTPAAVNANINETYYVLYTTDGSDPDATHGQRYTEPIEWNTPGTYFKAVTRATSCSDKMSDPVTLFFEHVKVTTPTITFANGQATIACTMDDVTIYYTTDGSTPTQSSTQYSAPFAVNYGVTVKAIAVKNVTTGYENSEVATAIYVPEGGSGTDENVVILDDREDHSWSYYSDGEQPIHSLKPADIKIVYRGNGTDNNNMTTTDTGDTPTSFGAKATGVKVGGASGETQNTFIYLKTLENANPEGSSGDSQSYTYTMIPNPFQVRPTGQSNGSGSVTPTTRTVYISGDVYGGYNNVDGLIQVTYTDANNNTQTWSTTTTSYQQNVTATITVKPGTDITVLARGRYYYQQGWSSGYLYSTVTARYDNANGTSIASATATNGNYQNGATDSGTVNSAGAQSVTYGTYRGFYAWRVKSLSSGLTIAGKSVGSIVYADEEITFETANAEDNEVEFEALWAQAYSVTSNTATGLNPNVSYERNFVVLSSNTTIRNAALSVPVTYTTLDPLTGTGTKRTITIREGFTCGADTKFENATLAQYYNNAQTITANNHDLIFGRGIDGTVSTVRGMSAGSSSAIDYTIRIESGSFANFYLGYANGNNTGVFENTFSAKGVLGCDYDHAKNNNSSLTISPSSNAGNIYGGTRMQITSEDNKDNLTFDWYVKSGNFHNGILGSADGGSQSIYLGSSQGGYDLQYIGKRRMTIEGGSFASVAGGMNSSDNDSYNNNYTTQTDKDNVVIRVKGGTIRGSIYGAAAHAGAAGGRTFVITKGTINGWIAGGCNGTRNTGGELFGSTYVYVGGNANVVQSSDDPYIGGETYNEYDQLQGENGAYGGNIFGAGCGIKPNGYDASNPGASLNNLTVGKVYGSKVVIADEATIGRDVYGGGNFGLVADASFGSNTDKTANIYILGGTINGKVFGGSNNQKGETVNVYVKGGKIIGRSKNNPVDETKVDGSVYGGSNVWGTINGLATVSMSGGEVANVFGGGYGPSTNMAAGTKVNVSGGTINNNVYGGGEEGTVSSGNTEVNVSGGTMKDVYGAGKGAASSTAQITGSTTVNISGGEIANVYGGGEAGDVVNGTNLASTVTISGGTVSGDVFGGGKMGKTTGNTMVNLENGNVRGYLYGGAYGETGSVFVAGTHTVNIMGGRVFGSVYGGSRNANDALTFTGYSTTEDKTSSVINISAGQVDQQVYVAGFFGRTYGSVYAFIGRDAILNAPNSMPSFGDDNETKYKAGNLHIEHNIWAGADFGDFTGGGFGGPTVSGYSDIYVDGNGYDTQTDDASAPTYMDIKGSIYGCGTSCDAGTKGRGIYVSNYGHANERGSKNDNFPEPYVDATRSFESIQRADTLVINNSHVNFTGQGMVYTTDATNKYAIVAFDKTVRMVGGSSLFMNAPTTQIVDFWSAKVDDIYKGKNAVYTALTVGDLATIDNKIRVNGGNYIEIYHDKMPIEEEGEVVDNAPGYGMLKGFAHMMVAASTSDNTCAYARPKQCQDTPIEEGIDNPTDGGWVSYDSEKNTFDINGNSHDDPQTGITVDTKVQMAYENHKNAAKNGEQYFRIWRAGGQYSEREANITAKADGTRTFSQVSVSVKLPAWRDNGSYYRFKTTGEAPNLNTTVDYGSDVMMFNSAMNPNEDWIHYDVANHAQATGALEDQQDKIHEKPNVNFGLVLAPTAGTGMNGNPLIVCNESDAFLASVTGTAPNYQTVNKFTCGSYEQNPEITFWLTYSNRISTNTTWDPMFVTLEQVNSEGVVTDIVRIDLIISTATSIDQEFITQTYAVMNGSGSPTDQYTAKVVLPSFDLFDYGNQDLSKFTVKNVTFATENNGEWVKRGVDGGYGETKFAMEVGPATNEDNTNGWDHMSCGMTDTKDITGSGLELGKTGARTPFAIDFRLNYKGDQVYEGTTPRLGVLTFQIEYTNVKVLDANSSPDNPTYHAETRTLTIKVEVIRRGKGNAFYLDGVNGSNANDALHPDQAVLALSNIFNRCGFLPGDVVYVVNTVSTGELTLEWSGTSFNNVTLYRYPGGHPLSESQKKDAQGNALFIDNVTGEETIQSTTNGEPNAPVMIPGEIVDNPDNEAFKGNLVVVNNKGKMVIRDITLDGHKSSHTTTAHDGTDAGVTADNALVKVEAGGLLTLSNGVTLKENSCTTDGAAVVVNGTLRMNNDATITGNTTTGNGGGVYMAGTMIVSDNVQVVGNTSGTAKAVVENNVFLTDKEKMVQIGTSAPNDGFEALTSDAKIGVTKDLYADIDGYTRVVNVETSNEIPWLEVPYTSDPNEVIYHDGQKYQLVKYATGNGSNQILYWIGTWVTVQDHEPTEEEGGWTGIDNIGNITTANQLAWVISLVNGENGCTADDLEGDTIVINNDIDMSYSIWVPIGTTKSNFKGTFEGNGHVITGIKSPLVNDNAAMFGITDGATIENAVVEVNFTGNSTNLGTFVGTMNGGTLANVEGAGTLEGKESTVHIGGLVGQNVGGTVHSSFAVNAISAENDEAVIAGLVGVNSGNLYNSYSNVTFAEGLDNTAGLVGVNTGIVENCYNASAATYAFVNENQVTVDEETTEGNINYCYAARGVTAYVNGDAPGLLTGHGNYTAVQPVKHLDYLYRDNKVTVAEGETNGYVKTAIEYSRDKHTVIWDGLVSALNEWVRTKNGNASTYTLWNRPINDAVNGDLPVLHFPKDNSMGSTDGKYLKYSTGLDNLLAEYASKTAGVFVYGAVTGVANVPTANVKVSIAEDAVLIQTDDAPDFKATVGVTFDNSDRGVNSVDNTGNHLEYDWHMMSTPLSNAPMGMTYGAETGFGGNVNVTSMVNNYFPNGLITPENPAIDGDTMWDIYSYSEKDYHWINLKRSDHYHIDGGAPIKYTNEENFVPGKGYMMAISHESYLNNTGMLNNGDVKAAVTNQEPDEIEFNKGWNLVGNPYQAYLDIDEIGHDIFVYNADLGVYAAYTASASENPDVASNYVHPHQAFFVYSAAEQDTLVFTKAMATAESNSNAYFRGEKLNYPLVNIFAKNELGNGDMTVIEFNRPEIGGVKEIRGLRNANFHIAASLNGQGYGLLFTPEGTERVPVRFYTEEDGTFTLTWNTCNGDFSSLLLVDNMTGTITDMLRSDHYTFNATTDDYASRFYITFAVTDVEEYNEGDNDFAWFDGSEWVVNGKGTLDVVDVLGRTVYSARLTDDQNRVNLNNVAKGVYMLRVSQGTSTKVQKVVVR